MMNINEELMAKARGAKSVEELLALAKENNVELTEEEANAYFEQMNRTGELSDDELDSVAGGGCGKKESKPFDPTKPLFRNGTCDLWEPYLVSYTSSGKVPIDQRGLPISEYNHVCGNCGWTHTEGEYIYCERRS